MDLFTECCLGQCNVAVMANSGGGFVKVDKNPHGVQLPSIGCYDGKEPPSPRMEGSFFKVKGKESKSPWNGFCLHVCLSH